MLSTLLPLNIQEYLYTTFFSAHTFGHILGNTLFAMVIGFGFVYTFNAPRNVFFGVIVISGLGYFVRSMLVQMPMFSLVGASFCASLCMGFGAMFIAKRLKVPTEVIVFPSLLPLFPGSYGYKSILSLLTFVQNSDKPEQLEYLLIFFNNSMTMLSVALSLVTGVLITFVIFHEQSFMMTRGVREDSLEQTKKHK